MRKIGKEKKSNPQITLSCSLRVVWCLAQPRPSNSSKPYCVSQFKLPTARAIPAISSHLSPPPLPSPPPPPKKKNLPLASPLPFRLATNHYVYLPTIPRLLLLLCKEPTTRSRIAVGSLSLSFSPHQRLLGWCILFAISFRS